MEYQFIAPRPEPPIVLNVKDFGAIGDGTTDDTAAIQRTLDACQDAGGGVAFFPVGTYLISIDSGNALMIPGRGITLQGMSRDKSIIKLAASQGDYVAMIANGTAGAGTNVTGFTARGLTFDQNASNNVITDITALMAGQSRYVFRLFSGTDLVFEDCRFTNCDNVNTISVNGGTTVGRVSVRYSLFDAHGGHSPDHDHSALYFNCTMMDVANNVFIGAGISARTAIETHGPGQAVTGNRIANFFTGMNLTGVSPLDSRGTTCSGNVITGCGVGIHLWSMTSGVNTSVGMEDVVVQGNTVEVDLDQWAAISASYKNGVLFDPSATLGFRNIIVRDNVIRYKAFTTVPTETDKFSAGICMVRASAYAGTDQNIVVAGNIIENCPAPGILIKPLSTMRSLHVKNNTITNPGSGASPNFATDYRTGLMLQGTTGTGPYIDLQVADNTFVDNRDTHLMTSGVDAHFITTTITGGKFQRNTILLTEGSAPLLTNASTVTWDTGAQAEALLCTAARYYTAPFPSRTTIVTVSGTCYAFPLWLARDQTFVRIGCEVTAVSAGSVVRLGIYADNGSGSPGARILDAGTVDTATAPAALELTISQALTPGLVWLCSAAQGGTPTMRAGGGALYPCGGGSLGGAAGAGGTYNGVQATGVSGAFPATFPAVTNFQAVTPIVVMRA